MKISFFLPQQFHPTPQEVASWSSGEGCLIYPEGLTCLTRNWIYQTWFWLHQSGVECELVSEAPSEGVFIANSDLLSTYWSQLEHYSSKVFIINILGDSLPFYYSNLYLVQNPLHAKCFPGSFYIPHWPHPYLKPRHLDRGDLLENILFYGNAENVDPYLLSHQWKKDLYEELGMHFYCADFYSWNDFSKTDVALGIRSFSRNRYLNKPGSKLYNAWIAGVPFIGGNDAAFSEEGEPQKDYLLATNLEGLMEQLRHLKKDPQLRHQLVQAGRQKAKLFSKEATLARWQNLLTQQLPPLVQEWEKSSYQKKATFWKRKYFHSRLDRLLRPHTYSPSEESKSWSLFIHYLDQIEILEKEVDKFQQVADQLQLEGNHHLASRWLQVIQLLKQLITIKSFYHLYSESPYIPQPPSKLYIEDGEKLLEKYFSEAKKYLELNDFHRSHQFMCWARSAQECQSAYQACAQQVYENFCHTYTISQGDIEVLLRNYKNHYQPLEMMCSNDEADKATQEFKKSLLSLLEQALRMVGETETLFLSLKQEKPLSELHAHDQRLTLFWSHFAASKMNHLIVAKQNARTMLIPLWQHVITSAQKASSYRYRAFSLLQAGSPYQAAFWRRAAYWQGCSAKMSILRVDCFTNQKLGLSVLRQVQKILQKSHKASFYYRLLIPFITFLENHCNQYLSTKWKDSLYQKSLSFIETKVTRSYEEVLSIISKHLQ